jgi:DNA-binding protein HU-beta
MGTTVSTTQLSAEVAKQAGVAQEQAQGVLQAWQTLATQRLMQGDRVHLTGFGTFKCTERAARNGTNPKTRQPMEIQPSTTVTFRPSDTLKRAVATGPPGEAEQEQAVGAYI